MRSLRGKFKSAPKKPGSEFLKDPEHLQKLDKAEAELKKAQDGDHQQLQDLRDKQKQHKEQTLKNETTSKQKADQDLQTAQRSHEKTQKKAQERTNNQVRDHQRAKDLRKDKRAELHRVRTGTQPSAADFVDRIETAEVKKNEAQEQLKTRSQKAKKDVSDAKSRIENRYAQQFKDNPKLRQDLVQYRELKEKLADPKLSKLDRKVASYKSSELRKKFDHITDDDGNRLSTDFSKLLQAEKTEVSTKASFTRSLKLREKEYKDLREKAYKLYAQKPGIRQKINDYMSAKAAFKATTPEGVAARNAADLKRSQTELTRATQAQQQADSSLQAAKKSYENKHGVDQHTELESLQNKLTTELQKRVKNLATITSQDLSPGLLKAPGFGYTSKYDRRTFTLKDGQLHYGVGGMKYVAKGTKDGGFQIDGQGTVNGAKVNRSTHRVQNPDGSWRTENDQKIQVSERSHQVVTYREFEDGSSSRRVSNKSKTNEDYFESKTTKGADGSSITESRSRRHGDRSVYRERVAPNGVKESYYRSDEIDGDDWLEVRTNVDAEGRKVTSSKHFSSQPWNNKTNVEGASWLWKHSPQNLRNAIGDNATFGQYTEKTRVEEPGKEPTTQKLETSRWTSADGKRSLDVERRRGLPDAWTYTNNKNGVKHSQTFYHGTEDNVIKKEYVDSNGFTVTKTNEDYETMSNKIAEKTGEPRPESGDSIVKVKDKATREDLERLIRQHPELKKVVDSDNYQKFLDAVGDGKFSLAFNDSEQTLTDGKEVYATSLTAVAPDGTKIFFMDGNEGAGLEMTSKDGQNSMTLYDARGNRLESCEKTGVILVDAKGVRQILKDTENLGTLAWRGPRAIGGLAQMARDLTGLGKGGRTGRLMTALGNLDNKFNTNFGRGLDKFALGLNAFHTVNSAMHGDWGKAASGLASTATDIGALSAHYGQGFRAGSYVDKFGKTANMWDEGATLTGVSRAAQLGKALGVAGAAYQLYTSYQDFNNGRHLRGGLGLAGAGGTALAIWGGTSWAGPVGWGVAAVATVGICTVDYVDANKIADPEIPLY